MSALEEELLMQIRAAKLPLPEREYRFSAHHVGMGKGIKERLRKAGLRDWRFDFAWPESMIAVEVEGGLFVGGRHTRGAGYENDLEKYCRAQELGWEVIRCGRKLISAGHALRTITILYGRARDEG